MDHLSHRTPSVFESADVIALVGIPAIYLNKFIERRLFGIRPSIRSGRGRGKRRLFSAEDVFGIALAWWLFRMLRLKTSRALLNDICGVREGGSANAASHLIRERKIREIRRQWAHAPGTVVFFNNKRGEKGKFRCYMSMVFPVGKLFAELKKAMVQFERKAKGK
jgi:hypothetical protein